MSSDEKALKPSQRIAEILLEKYRATAPIALPNAIMDYLDEQAELLDTHTVKEPVEHTLGSHFECKVCLQAHILSHTLKEEKLKCGCVKNTCKCDPMRHWPPVCCDKCPSLPKEEDYESEPCYQRECNNPSKHTNGLHIGSECKEEPTTPEKQEPQYKIACNDCGSGKQLYYTSLSSDKRYKPYDGITKETRSHEKKCPSCKSLNVEATKI